MAYSKNPNFNPIFSRALCAIIFPGAPISERLPPIAAANTSGIRNLERLYPDFAAIPTTTGISTAAVPVLDSTPLITPTITMIATISILSVLANRVTKLPILFAIPVSNRAPPTMNIATNKITLLSINPAKAVPTSKTPVTTRPIHTIMEVTPSGSFSITNITIANARNRRVIVAWLISFPPYTFHSNWRMNFHPLIPNTTIRPNYYCLLCLHYSPFPVLCIFS